MNRKNEGLTKKDISEIHKENNVRFTANSDFKNQHDKIGLLDFSEIYHNNSKITRKNYKKLSKLEELFTSPDIIKKLLNTYTSYIKTEEIFLPIENIEITTPFHNCISNRRSARSFTGEAININQLSKLLWHSYGITGMLKLIERDSKEEVTGFVRAIPSGGSLYPIELYLAIYNVEGLKKGIYHYNVKNHSLEMISEWDNYLDSFINMFTLLPDFVNLKKTCATILLTDAYWKQNGKYGARGYRFSLMEAGHIAQNIQLACAGINIGSLCIGGYYDDELNNLIEIDEKEEPIVYAVAVGISEKDTMIMPLEPGEARK
jgi:SagB-type dehydrogenase family enzyme